MDDGTEGEGGRVGTRYRVMVERLKELHRGWDLDIRPPPEGPAAGAVRQAGGSGLVRYAFSADEHRAYLEFYSFHRISGDLHARIFESGEVEHLAVLETTLALPGDPENDRRLREQQDLRNRTLMEELEAAGLLSGGPVPGSFAVNAAIATGLAHVEKASHDDDDDDDDERP